MKIFNLKLIAAVAALVAAGTSSAASLIDPTVDLDLGTGASNYAKELSYTAAAPLQAAATGKLSYVAKMGFGISATSTRFVRIEYTNAKLASAQSALPAAIEVTSDNGAKAGATIINTTGTLVSGGQIGDTFAVIQLLANADINALNYIRIKSPDLEVIDTAQPVTVKYVLHETGASASAGSAGLAILASKSNSLAKFTSGWTTTFAPAALVATVADGFKKFNLSTFGELGTVVAGVGAQAPLKKDSSGAVVLADLVNVAATKSVMTITGDFSSALAGGVYLSVAPCVGVVPSFAAGTVQVGVINAAKTSATIDLNGVTDAAVYRICLANTGTTAINAGTYKASVAWGSATGATVPAVAAVDGNAGTITRDGTELQAPFVQNPGATYLTRFVLTNTADTAADFTGTVYAGSAYTNAGVLIGTLNTVKTNGTISGQIPAKGQVIIEGDQLPTFNQAQRGMVVFTVNGQSTKVQGAYSITNVASGSVSTHALVRPGTN